MHTRHNNEARFDPGTHLVFRRHDEARSTRMREQRPEAAEVIESGNRRSTRLPGLRAARQKQGLTQRELAALAGTGASTVADIESGRRGGYPKTVRRIADALGTDVKHLIEE